MRPATRPSTLAFALVFLGLVLVPAASADERETRRLLRNLAVDSERVQSDVELFLRDGRRWEPAGRDADLWNELGELARAADQLDRSYVAGPYAGFEDDARRVLLRGRAAERLLVDANPDRRTRDGWARVRDGLRELASSQGWDYDTARFDTGGRRTGSVARAGDVRPAPDTRGGEPIRDRRFSAADDREVGQILSGLRRNADVLARVSPYDVDDEEALTGLGIAIARDVVGIPASGGAAPADPFVADLSAFQQSVSEAHLRYQEASRAADVDAEVRSLHRLAEQIDAEAKNADTSKDFRRRWEQTRRDVNRLAEIYGLAR